MRGPVWGLSLVHGIVADLGGAIDVSSTLGEGTRFGIWLPVAGETAVVQPRACGQAAARTMERS